MSNSRGYAAVMRSPCLTLYAYDVSYTYNVRLSRMPGTTRARLTRARVLEAALALADAGGVHSLSMRKLAAKLGVDAMSLYRQVAGKEDILDSLADIVAAGIEVPSPVSADWKNALRTRAMSARDALNRHPWAVGLMATRMRPGSWTRTSTASRWGRTGSRTRATTARPSSCSGSS